MKFSKIGLAIALAASCLPSAATVRYKLTTSVIWQPNPAPYLPSNYLYIGTANDFIAGKSTDYISTYLCDPGIINVDCQKPEFVFDATIPYFNGPPGTQAVMIGIAYGDRYMEHYAFYFAGNTFSTIGTHQSLGLGTRATLEVSTIPVPEPATFALMAMGLGAVGLAARRKKA